MRGKLTVDLQGRYLRCCLRQGGRALVGVAGRHQADALSLGRGLSCMPRGIFTSRVGQSEALGLKYKIMGIVNLSRAI
jgi:hypothetical protein